MERLVGFQPDRLAEFPLTPRKVPELLYLHLLERAHQADVGQTINYLALVGYLVYPMVPPWLAADDGLLPPLARLSTRRVRRRWSIRMVIRVL